MIRYESKEIIIWVVREGKYYVAINMNADTNTDMIRT